MKVFVWKTRRWWASGDYFLGAHTDETGERLRPSPLGSRGRGGQRAQVNRGALYHFSQPCSRRAQGHSPGCRTPRSSGTLTSSFWSRPWLGLLRKEGTPGSKGRSTYCSSGWWQYRSGRTCPKHTKDTSLSLKGVTKRPLRAHLRELPCRGTLCTVSCRTPWKVHLPPALASLLPPPARPGWAHRFSPQALPACKTGTQTTWSGGILEWS